MEEFSGKQLIQQESDASSFPNGGIRSTFEARGYSAWDTASPVFVLGDTLMIPTIFISYTGEALDYKAPLKKAIHAVDKAATDVCRYFYSDVKKVISNLGWEQEYFLVDEGLYATRPDLLMTGRTLMGHESAKNQQMDDHYFGSIPERVAEFMKDLEIQALELGIPCKTRHNEVAPNQFELAPIFEETNLAVDHNMLLMSLMKKIARKHGFRCLLHEKPFAGINGSGKHNNWSLATDTGILLHGPGKTPTDNLRFVTFIVETLMAVYRHNGLLKASIMSATNAHRLGGNEAPPAIISSFLGQQLSDILEHLENSTDDELIDVASKHGMKLDIPQIPELMFDNTDRNRTSPFAFTGNRFEFRAVGSQANCAAAMIVLNAAMAEALIDFKKRVDALIEKGRRQDQSHPAGGARGHQDLQAHPLRRERILRRMASRGPAPRAGHGAQLSARLRPLFGRKQREDVRGHSRVHAQRNRSSKRNQMGDLHEKGANRGAHFRRHVHEPHHPRGHALPKCLDRQRA